MQIGNYADHSGKCVGNDLWCNYDVRELWEHMEITFIIKFIYTHNSFAAKCVVH